ncbi:agmatine deiminase family protein [Gilvimarinus xylanilyticus]|uniref:Agmatine deiminase family protein n=1 Tax=Gilvimarinus xylanilyticus TaxID=2944139 RepID=A0A9X2HU89_9GAMM|nr:agmatine deiminase family protein [Gilvimarinus xylanilyticus]MCP8898578.1 agmatine deiminase family protein [Gilvimarinus xylanilyticus]
MNQFRLLPEWAPQDGVLLTWPHAKTDWAPLLDEVETVYGHLAREICRRAELIIAAPAETHSVIRNCLIAHQVDCARCHLVDADTQDTWARDHGPLTVEHAGKLKILDFTFNGWGNKFAADLDNQINQRLDAQGVFKVSLTQIDMVLEGGAVEIDETGALLTTRACLLNPNRNPHLSEAEVEALLQKHLGAKRINWLDYGYLAGDDTDSHIDTLARLAPEGGLVHVSCDDPEDEHYHELQQMRHQLEGMTDANNRPYTLYPLPWPQAIYDAEGNRLPATYANFLILNGAVLVPVYQDEQDESALQVVGRAFPGYEIIGIDCRVLIEQHGSLHCITMQLPEGAITP